MSLIKTLTRSRELTMLLTVATGKLRWTPKTDKKTEFSTRQGLFSIQRFKFWSMQHTKYLLEVDGGSPSRFTVDHLFSLFGCHYCVQSCLSRTSPLFGWSSFQAAQANLKVKPSKCNLFASQVQYLGHIISDERLMADPAKVEAVRGWPVSKNQTEVRSFVGLASHYRRFVKEFTEIAHPLHQFTEKRRLFQ